jgi:predicted porin
MKTLRVLVTVLVLLAAISFVAGAQSTTPAIGQPGSLLEPYGVADVALRASTNSDVNGNTYFGLAQGLFNGSRWGLRGTEDLGGSLKAVYTLEGGVIIPSGQIDQQGQIFGRQAWVGLKSDYGTLTFGRQYGVFTQAVGAGDVFGATHGNASYFSSSAPNGNNYETNDAVNAFFENYTGLRWDQSITYVGSFSGVNISVQAMPGMLPGTSGATDGYIDKNAMIGGSIGYSSNDIPISGALGVQEEADQNYNHHFAAGAGLKYALDSTDNIYLMYIYSAFDSGFLRINSNDSEIKFSAVTGAGSSVGQQDNVVNLGVNYYVLPALNVILSLYFDYGQNVVKTGDDGERYSGLLAVDYYFSKDFDAYIGAWYTQFADAFEQAGVNGGDEFANYSSVFSAMMGVRFRF